MLLCRRMWQTQTHQHLSISRPKIKTTLWNLLRLVANPGQKNENQRPFTIDTYLLQLLVFIDPGSPNRNQSSAPIRKRLSRNFLSFVDHQETRKPNRFLLWWTPNKRAFNKSILDSRSSRPSSWYQLLIFYIQQPGTYVAEYSNFEEE